MKRHIFLLEDYDIVDNFLFLFLADGINVSWCILMLNLKLKWGNMLDKAMNKEEGAFIWSLINIVAAMNSWFAT